MSGCIDHVVNPRIERVAAELADALIRCSYDVGKIDSATEFALDGSRWVAYGGLWGPQAVSGPDWPYEEGIGEFV